MSKNIAKYEGNHLHDTFLHPKLHPSSFAGKLFPSPSPSTNKKVVFLKKSKEGWEDISVLFLCLVIVAFFPRSPLFIQKGCFFHFFLMFSKMKQKGWDACCLFFSLLYFHSCLFVWLYPYMYSISDV